jgi:hypothetical protein
MSASMGLWPCNRSEIDMNPYDNAENLMRVLSAPRRNQYFYGKRMDVQHFRMEQDYLRQKLALLNRLTLGKGVLCGLRVTLEDGKLCVDPGVAIDGLGREIVVPVRTCIDPAAPATMCCGDPSASTLPAPDGVAVFTLWACYRECSADYQPMLASDCDARSDCAAGTTVETFCFKVTPGLAPLQGDPRWCIPQAAAGQDGTAFGTQPEVPMPAGFDAFIGDQHGISAQDILDAVRSRRHGLCSTLGRDCDLSEGDPCVPLAAILVSDASVRAVENCLVRPRLYSHERLLDMILCLAQRVDACCKPAPVDLMQVASIDFLYRGGPVNSETVVASVKSPLKATQVAIGGQTNAIRIKFSRPFAQGPRQPSTAGIHDASFERHNVLVLPEQPLQGERYVPGSLVIESAQVVRFDLADDTIYSRGPQLGWQKGRYRILLAGVDDPQTGRRALADMAGSALDGEPAAPANGVISGDGTKGGDFAAVFTVG